MFVTVIFRVRPAGAGGKTYRLGPYFGYKDLEACNRWMLAVSRGVARLNKKLYGYPGGITILFGLGTSASDLTLAKVSPARVLDVIEGTALDNSAWPPKDFDKKGGSA